MAPPTSRVILCEVLSTSGFTALSPSSTSPVALGGSKVRERNRRDGEIKRWEEWVRVDTGP